MPHPILDRTDILRTINFYSKRIDMWKNNQKVTITGYNKHKAIVKKCLCEHHRIIANAQRTKFKEAKEKLAEGYYLVGEEIADVSRA